MKAAVKICLLMYMLMLSLQPVLAIPAYLSVNLFQAHQPARQITVSGPIYIRSTTGSKQYLPAGKYTLAAEEKQITIKSSPSSSALCRASALTIEAAGADTTGKVISVSYPPNIQRRYQGQLKVTINPQDTLHICNIVNAKDYVVSVVGSETWPNWPVEALKAQAVLTQTRLARMSEKSYLSDSTEQEAYLGADYAHSDVKNAVNAVWGQALTFNHRPIIPFYHAACGGATSSGIDTFGQGGANIDYLTSVKCSFCNKSPFWQTKYSLLPASAIERNANGKDFQAVQILKEDSAGRPTEVKLANGRITSGYKLWLELGQTFGWDKAPGTRYKLCQQNDHSIKISSNGAGHGVGMCQWGAATQARMGKSYKDVLHYYFPATSIEQYF